jgi:hypothetical protein
MLLDLKLMSDLGQKTPEHNPSHSECDKLHYLFFGFFFDQISGWVTIQGHTLHPRIPESSTALLSSLHVPFHKETNKQENKHACPPPSQQHTLQDQGIFVQVNKVLNKRWVFDIEATLPLG